MKNLGTWLVLGLFLCLPIRFVCMYGSEWDFGRYWMPRALVARDGVSFLNGREIDPFWLALIREDTQEETMLGAVGVLGVLIVGVGMMCWSVAKGQSEQARLESIRDDLKRQQRRWGK